MFLACSSHCTSVRNWLRPLGSARAKLEHFLSLIRTSSEHHANPSPSKKWIKMERLGNWEDETYLISSLETESSSVIFWPFSLTTTSLSILLTHKPSGCGFATAASPAVSLLGNVKSPRPGQEMPGTAWSKRNTYPLSVYLVKLSKGNLLESKGEQRWEIWQTGHLGSRLWLQWNTANVLHMSNFALWISATLVDGFTSKTDQLPEKMTWWVLFLFVGVAMDCLQLLHRESPRIALGDHGFFVANRLTETIDRSCVSAADPCSWGKQNLNACKTQGFRGFRGPFVPPSLFQNK